MINRRFDSIWTGKTKLSGYSVIVLDISTETDNSPSSRLAEIVNSLCGGRERKQSKQVIESCPVEAIVLALPPIMLLIWEHQNSPLSYVLILVFGCQTDNSDLDHCQLVSYFLSCCSWGQQEIFIERSSNFFTKLSPQLLGISLCIKSLSHSNNEHFHLEKTWLPKK